MRRWARLIAWTCGHGQRAVCSGSLVVEVEAMMLKSIFGAIFSKNRRTGILTNQPLKTTTFDFQPNPQQRLLMGAVFMFLCFHVYMFSIFPVLALGLQTGAQWTHIGQKSVVSGFSKTREGDHTSAACFCENLRGLKIRGQNSRVRRGRHASNKSPWVC